LLSSIASNLPSSSVSAVMCSASDKCNGWGVCNRATNTCEIPSRECPNGCSLHGSCMFLNVNTAIQISDCRSGDPFCDAVCQCDAGYFGTD
jgi:hypothetical protein